MLDGAEQEKAIDESYHLSKQRSFPVIYIDGTCVIGFHESRLRHLLKLPSQKEEQERIKSEDGEIKTGLVSRERDYHETIEKMREWLMREAKSHGYTINPDKQVVEEILAGLAINEKRYGYKACPCRLATGNTSWIAILFASVPIVFWMLKKNGRCYCSLFVSDRFVASDPALPEYVPDLREKERNGRKEAATATEEVSEASAEAPAIPLKTRIKIVALCRI